MSDMTTGSRPLSVLVAEDDRVNQRLVVGMLERLGHRVELATNGAEAVTAATRASFDLALMDLGMPVLDGIAATAAIRRHEATLPGRHLLIVALTAVDAEDRARCLDAGADRCIAKPLTPRDLAAVLDWARQPGNDVPDGSADDSDTDDDGEPPALDATMADQYAEDTAFLGILIGEFLAESSRRINALRDAYGAADVAALRFEAHALKGGASVFGAAPLAELCLRLEHVTALDDVGTQLDRVEAEARRLAAALEIVRRERCR